MTEGCCVKTEFPPGRIAIGPQRALNIATVVSHSTSISGLQTDHRGKTFCWSNKSTIMANFYVSISSRVIMADICLGLIIHQEF